MIVYLAEYIDVHRYVDAFFHSLSEQEKSFIIAQVLCLEYEQYLRKINQ